GLRRAEGRGAREGLRPLRRRRLRASLHRGARAAQGGRIARARARRAAYAHRRHPERPAAPGDPRRQEEADVLPRRLRSLRAAMIVFRPTPGFAYSHPAHVIAFGFGAGLARFAPGTCGTLAGWPFGWVLAGAHPAVIFPLVAALFLLGVWACGVTARHLGVHDHGSMVWDEIVAFMLVAALLPREPGWQLAGFVAFRA